MEKDNGLGKREKCPSGNAIDLFGQVRQKIMYLRDCQVILDADVAELYGVKTREVNQAVRNNPEKILEGYVFGLDRQEFAGRCVIMGNLATPKPLRLGHAQAREWLGMELDLLGALASPKTGCTSAEFKQGGLRRSPSVSAMFKQGALLGMALDLLGALALHSVCTVFASLLWCYRKQAAPRPKAVQAEGRGQVLLALC